MSTPINHYYLRSTTDQPTEGRTGLEAETISEDSLDLSDLEGSIVFTDEEEPEPQEMATPHITISPFHGNPGERAEEWLAWYNNFADVYNYNEDKRLRMLPFYLKDHAVAWYTSLPSETKDDFTALTDALKQRFNGSDGLDRNMALLSLSQQRGESCTSYFTRILKVTNNQRYPEDLLTSVALKGLNAEIKTIVMPQNNLTLEDLRKASIMAERTVAATASSICAATNFQDNLSRQLKEMTERLAQMELRYQQPRQQDPQPTWSRNRNQKGSRKAKRESQMQGTTDDEIKCARCEGKFSHTIENCPAYDKTCSYCGKRGHFTETCFKRKNDLASSKQS